MGTGTGRSLNMTIRVVAGPADSLNLIDISAYVVSLNIFADISALVDANAFLHFPLGDILNFNCWLAALRAVQLNKKR